MTVGNIPARLVVAGIRLVRMAFLEQAREAHDEDRPDKALGLWQAAEHMTACETFVRRLLKE